MCAVLLMALTGLVSADQVSQSSFTTTNDVATLNSQTSTNTLSHTLIGVMVSCPTTGGILRIFNSSFTTAVMSTVAVINMNALGNYPFYNRILKGITYSISGNGNGVTIIYKD